MYIEKRERIVGARPPPSAACCRGNTGQSHRKGSHRMKGPSERDAMEETEAGAELPSGELTDGGLHHLMPGMWP
ncbi:Cyclic Nucleotide-Gated Cation Channel Beta-1 [Manis pentadactyla]|nr:Cyclic Nucleotide-Gated Cation Channel Beta-1 [Manis pentadactyla]